MLESTADFIFNNMALTVAKTTERPEIFHTHFSPPFNAKTGKEYNGDNVLLLSRIFCNSSSSKVGEKREESFYDLPGFLTFKQATEMGINVKGKKTVGKICVYTGDNRGDENVRYNPYRHVPVFWIGDFKIPSAESSSSSDKAWPADFLKLLEKKREINDNAIATLNTNIFSVNLGEDNYLVKRDTLRFLAIKALFKAKLTLKFTDEQTKVIQETMQTITGEMDRHKIEFAWPKVKFGDAETYLDEKCPYDKKVIAEARNKMKDPIFYATGTDYYVELFVSIILLGESKETTSLLNFKKLSKSILNHTLPSIGKNDKVPTPEEIEWKINKTEHKAKILATVLSTIFMLQSANIRYYDPLHIQRVIILHELWKTIIPNTPKRKKYAGGYNTVQISFTKIQKGCDSRVFTIAPFDVKAISVAYDLISAALVNKATSKKRKKPEPKEKSEKKKKEKKSKKRQKKSH